MRRDDQINQALQMYVLLLRNKQLFFYYIYIQTYFSLQHCKLLTRIQLELQSTHTQRMRLTITNVDDDDEEK